MHSPKAHTKQPSKKTHTLPLDSERLSISESSPKSYPNSSAPQVIQSSFLSSASKISNAPAPNASEIVFLGRSNVGKSTLINALLNKPLAKSSSTPGKTQLLNFFHSLWHFNGEALPLCFIDLPGFGYAKVSKSLKSQWEKTLLDFLLKRHSIKLFLHLIDARHTQLEIDSEVSALLAQIKRGDQHILRIYTKADKLNQNDLGKLAQKTQAIAQTSGIQSCIFSAQGKAHRKITSTPLLRTLIAHATLGIEDSGAVSKLD